MPPLSRIVPLPTRALLRGVPFLLAAACGPSDPPKKDVRVATPSPALGDTAQAVAARVKDAAMPESLAPRRPAIDSSVRVDSAGATGPSDSTRRPAADSGRWKPRPPVLRGRAAPDSIAIASLDRDSLRVTGWPVKQAPSLPGAVVPGARIIAYYGNPLSTRMGILGEIAPEQMMARLEKEAAEWQRADPSTKVIPALHIVGVVAQGSAGRDGKWRARMNDSLLARVQRWADSKGWLYFIDVQVGLSTLREELPRLRPWLEKPNVHLGIDPEFSMKDGSAPGKKIGTFNAADVNYAVRFLSEIVREKKIPPKVLIVHRFTRGMVTGTSDIALDPAVQVVMQMDGWGRPALKIATWRNFIQPEPVQFTGFKIFYKNDAKSGQPILRPGEVLRLWPRPVYIQYQ